MRKLREKLSACVNKVKRFFAAHAVGIGQAIGVVGTGAVAVVVCAGVIALVFPGAPLAVFVVRCSIAAILGIGYALYNLYLI